MQILARKKTRKISFIQVVSEPHWGQNVFSEIVIVRIKNEVFKLID